jgi:hypothetical protein
MTVLRVLSRFSHFSPYLSTGGQEDFTVTAMNFALDDCDSCPDDPDKTEPGECGCGIPETGDSDGDGVHDCNDECPTTAARLKPANAAAVFPRLVIPTVMEYTTSSTSAPTIPTPS